MKYLHWTLVTLLLLSLPGWGQQAQMADKKAYLADVKKQLNAVWPKNRTVNIVFHGHSVPAGFWHDHEVHTLESYPHLVLKALKEKYPYAVINTIVTAIGGENSQKGNARLEKEVLVHRPDVLLIDYALNDRFIGLEKSKEAWEDMIRKALAQNIKVILVTPSPDQRVDILAADNPLEQHTEQIRQLAIKYGIGLADPYVAFKKIAASGKLKEYMSHVNHPNQSGHELIAQTIAEWLVEQP
ncbi:SGNH/GDSL hydrolase family protein [Telluribacter sp. SYSU D00476]|uniref:SGNH/GDSL hydrolase family protein n=1 Tax=Telluribacter sp. SYSU D00476 TaxID=2811430 RepID=UPI001FF0E51B|nr:SGNH/GDSL hydrolase family protein [Telluribacter sp. SYSU D00476]